MDARAGVVVSARQDGALAVVAGELGLELLGVFGGGGTGAARVRDGEGRELVLKVMPGAEWGPRMARGAALSARVRAPDYPVPRYAGTGVARGLAWSLQERLPGDVPAVMTAAHAGQLLALVRRHRGAAGAPGDLRRRFDQDVGDAVARLSRRADTAPLAWDLRDVLARPDVAVRTGDVVHGDFHHRNYLAVGDRVTGVFDWELAWAGDWRVDLVELACWASWAPEQVPPAVARLVVDDAVARCEPEVLALFTAFTTVRSLGSELWAHPERLPARLATIDQTTRAWLDLA